MALWLRLMVNDEPIGYVRIRRREPAGAPGPDDVCVYNWSVSYRDDVYSGQGLEHRYGDGALALVRSVLEALPAEATVGVLDG